MTAQIDLGLSGPPVERSTSSILQSVWKRWWIVAISVIGVAAIAVGLIAVIPPTYSSSTELVVQDPQNSQVFDLPAQTDPERYVADQVQILRSHQVAVRAAAILAASGLDAPIPEAEDFTPPDGRLDVSSKETSNVITITFEDQDPEVAHAAADAVTTAYGEVRLDEAFRSFSSALEQLDSRITELDDQIDSIALTIDPDLPPETEAALDEHSRSVLDRIIELQNQLLNETTQAEIDAINGQLEGLTGPAATIDAILSASQPTNVEGLLNQQSELITRRAELAARRDEIAVNAELAAGGVAFTSPSAGPVQSGYSGRQVAILGAFVGLIIGAALAHWLASKDRRLTDEDQPAAILHVPLLAEIPHFSHENLTTQLPVGDSPRSAAAEAFRFAASSLEIRRTATRARCLAIVSGTIGAGKTTVTANLALALANVAAGSKRVVVVDADFGSQKLTSLLIGDDPSPGITDVLLDRVGLREALREVDIPGDGSLYLLSRGLQRINAPSMFSSDGARKVFEELRQQFDLVLIDTPPILQIAYAYALADLADGTVVIAGHQTDSTDLEEVSERLGMLSSPLLGYLYTMGPLRERMTQTGGSMTDIIGDSGFDAPGGKGPRS